MNDTAAPDTATLDELHHVSKQWTALGQQRKDLIRRAILERWPERTIGEAALVKGPSIHTEKKKMRAAGLLPPTGEQ